MGIRVVVKPDLDAEAFVRKNTVSIEQVIGNALRRLGYKDIIWIEVKKSG